MGLGVGKGRNIAFVGLKGESRSSRPAGSAATPNSTESLAVG